ncbi:hypothetical protein FQZ97_1149880 [compost metagenome]
MKPSRSKPARMHTSPDTTAIMLASTTARCGSPLDCASTTVRITATSAESGPSTRMRLGPNRA